jgi:hypothetical protein
MYIAEDCPFFLMKIVKLPGVISTTPRTPGVSCGDLFVWMVEEAPAAAVASATATSPCAFPVHIRTNAFC